MSSHTANAVSKRERRSAAYRLSITVALILGVITIIEYFMALITTSAIILLLLGLVKGYAVVVYYMHISRLWSDDEH